MNNSTSATESHNRFNPGNIAFTLLATTLLWILIPGCGFFYSGMSRRGSSLSVLILAFWSIALVSIQWYVMGYSLAFSPTSNLFVGNFRHVFLIGVYDGFYPEAAADQVPEMLFCFYQCVTATLAPALILGVVAERGRVLPAIVFILIWTTFAYDPIASWSLNYRGWSARLGVLDFGGAAPVHVPAAAAALAYTLLLGPRKKADDNDVVQPHNMSTVTLGATLIWLGTLGNNAGSAFSGSMAGIMTLMTTNLSCSAGAITWTLLDYRVSGCLSAIGFTCGAVAGLITIIPAAGFVNPTSSIIMGILGAAASNGALVILKSSDRFEDTLDIISLHGTSGVIGNILTGVFAQKAYGGELAKNGGWVDGHWFQVPIQMLDTVASFTWSFIVSFLTLCCMNRIPCLRLRVSPTVERHGTDKSQVGIWAYEFMNGKFPNDKPFVLSVLTGMPREQIETVINNKYRIQPISFLP